MYSTARVVFSLGANSRSQLKRPFSSGVIFGEILTAYGNTVDRDAGEILYLDDPGRLKLGLGGKAGFALFAFGAIEDSGNLYLVLHAGVQGKALAGADEVDGGGSEEVGSEVERDLARQQGLATLVVQFENAGGVEGRFGSCDNSLGSR